MDPANRRDEFSEFRYYERKARARLFHNNREGGDVTLEQIKAQWDAQNGKCAYTGIALTLWRVKRRQSTEPWEVASLDRIDSSLPYTAGNIQFVSSHINYMKNSMSDQQTRTLLDIIRRSA